jgi:hypothetical protein
MNLNEQLDKLRQLRDLREGWSATDVPGQLVAHIGDLLLLICNDAQGVRWSVSDHSSGCDILKATEAPTVRWAMKQCADFTIAYLQKVAHPQHLEN